MTRRALLPRMSALKVPPMAFHSRDATFYMRRGARSSHARHFRMMRCFDFRQELRRRPMLNGRRRRHAESTRATESAAPRKAYFRHRRATPLLRSPTYAYCADGRCATMPRHAAAYARDRRPSWRQNAAYAPATVTRRYDDAQRRRAR